MYDLCLIKMKRQEKKIPRPARFLHVPAVVVAAAAAGAFLRSDLTADAGDIMLKRLWVVGEKAYTSRRQERRREPVRSAQQRPRVESALQRWGGREEYLSRRRFHHHVTWGKKLVAGNDEQRVRLRLKLKQPKDAACSIMGHLLLGHCLSCRSSAMLGQSWAHLLARCDAVSADDRRQIAESWRPREQLVHAPA